jgi:5-methylcytosine-specific restriction protein A
MVVNRKRSEYAAHSKRVTKTKRWKALRLEVLRRDEWKCLRCNERRRLEVDHILPVKTHPELSFGMSNLQTLCCRCHARKSRLEVGHKPLPPKSQEWRNLLSKMENTNA